LSEEHQEEKKKTPKKICTVEFQGANLRDTGTEKKKQAG
jgi:hypothetical protein